MGTRKRRLRKVIRIHSFKTPLGENNLKAGLGLLIYISEIQSSTFSA
jgi:hypothetical protein